MATVEIVNTQRKMPERLYSYFLWVFFFCVLLAATFSAFTPINLIFGEVYHINSFSLLIASVVLLFGAIVTHYATYYLQGFQYARNFYTNSFLFLLSVISLVTAHHLLVLCLSWLGMGIFMSRLIGLQKNWWQAQKSARIALIYFSISSLILFISLFSLAYYTQQYTLPGILNHFQEAPSLVLNLAVIGILLVCFIQSAIYPFQSWLLNAMTAPTPASALMHAGFVNGAGILLALLAPLMVFTTSHYFLFVIGGITAIIAQFNKLIQTNVKQKLACSTIAQMGFMLMQCGLGFYNAAVAHLILHGFYKAYLFLSAGSEIKQLNIPKPHSLKITVPQIIWVILFALAGGSFFSLLTAKTSFTNSAIFLTIIVAITVAQSTYNILKYRNVSWRKKIFSAFWIFIFGISSYAVLYAMVSYFMKDMPYTAQPEPLGFVHLFVAGVFLLGFFIMKLGLYKKLPWLYVVLLNLSQPKPSSSKS
jgi:NAD(P)H-quinone oxidoreductase subunit 5